MVRISLLQFDPQARTVSENLSYICDRLTPLNDCLVVLPELFLTSYTTYDFIPAAALKTVLAPLLQLSRTNALALTGSLPVSTPVASYNRGILIDQGRLWQHKDKKNLFGPEKDVIRPGRRNPLFTYKDISFALQICLDIIDPIPAHYAARRGATVVINPATVSVDFLRTINKARALENGITTVFCNRSGAEKNGIQYLGQSSVFFADGAEKTVNQQEGMLSFTLQ